MNSAKDAYTSMIKVLLQTTIALNSDDWDIERFSLLRKCLSAARGAHDEPVFDVTSRNLLSAGQPDPVLSKLHESDFDELWLFAVDTGDGLTPEDCAGISRFHRRGSGLMVTRDHMDLGSSLCGLGCGPGAAHYFHSRNLDPDESRRCIDDPYTSGILWPNLHSGANGDFQHVRIVGVPHPVLRDPLSQDGFLQYLPTHPHEGSVCAPAGDPTARVILEGQSAVTGRPFNLAVAFEASDAGGPAIAQSTFHHFCDYNWDTASGAPSFVSEAPGNGMHQFPEAMRSTRQYVRNIALWLAGKLPV
jgi:hypothetical protein